MGLSQVSDVYQDQRLFQTSHVYYLKISEADYQSLQNGLPGQPPNGSGSQQGPPQSDPPPNLASKMLESAATTFASIIVLGAGFAAGGYLYHRFYKWLVVAKIENAFTPGDPALELASMGKQIPNTIASERNYDSSEEHWVIRDEQEKIDRIINGKERGHYHLLIGEKGTGKSSMLLDAMHKIKGEGVSMLEAHADLEIFRFRLGKALDFEFHEDYVGSYFSERGPRDSTALLDIERAFNKLEKVALKRRRNVGKPLILVINAIHLLRDDKDGRDLLELLQQRAEQWAASNLVTMVFNSDDYWIYERLKSRSTRMEVTTVSDLPMDMAVASLRNYRSKFFSENPSSQILHEVYKRVGGRLTYLNRVAKSKDMLKTCDEICGAEKTWFLNQCGLLGMDMDDDVMDQQKYASAAFVLAKALVDLEKYLPSIFDPERGHVLPEMPLHKARQVMTRADFIREYDHVNIFTITSKAMVRADSVPMQRAFREICAEDGFEKFLEDTLQRIGDIESLGRTREVVAKDLVGGGKYRVRVGEDRGVGWLGGGGGGKKKVVEIEVVSPPEEEEEDGDDGSDAVDGGEGKGDKK